MRSDRGGEADPGIEYQAGHAGIKVRNLRNRKKENFGRQSGQACI